MIRVWPAYGKRMAVAHDMRGARKWRRRALGRAAGFGYLWKEKGGERFGGGVTEPVRCRAGWCDEFAFRRDEIAKDHGPSVKEDDVYEALREDGASKEKAARIANAKADKERSPSRKGGEAAPYEEWTKKALYERAQELDVEGRSKMDEGELVAALTEG